MKSISLGERLTLAASYVREGAVLADIGTDHGYLPIYLLGLEKIKSAVCSDINRGPLANAEENVREFGFSDRVVFRLCSGAEALSDLPVTDYAICGMGGELIAGILEASPHIRCEGANFVLQPMSRPELLRAYLWSQGFEIISEGYCRDEGKFYLCINARYGGRVRKYTEEEAYFGEERHHSASSAFLGYMRGRAAALRTMIKGKTLGGEECESERALYKYLLEKLQISSDGEVL